MSVDWYDKEGRPLTPEKFEQLQRTDPEYKRVASSVITSSADASIRLWVSTVWLGLDHSFTPGDRPVIFETMVFSSEAPSRERACHRYCTEQEAREGHQELVQQFAADIPGAIIEEDAPQPEGVLMSPEERRDRLQKAAAEARELMAEMDQTPTPPASIHRPGLKYGDELMREADIRWAMKGL